MLTTNLGTSTTIFVGNHYEVTDGVVTKYYFAGGQRIAMRTGSTLNYLLSDHLGSTSLTTNAAGTVISEMRYKAWGETRYVSGSGMTKYQYTGQYSYATEFGLQFYNARWYDSSLGRFAQADSIVPGTENGQAWDRYAYTYNNPIRNNDPSGHEPGDCYDRGYCDKKWKSQKEFILKAESPLHEDDGPVNYSGFGGCNTITGSCNNGHHPSLDSRNNWDTGEIVNWEGRPIYAIEPGIVIKTGASDWGNYVMVEHDVLGEQYYSIYAHLQEATTQEGILVDNDTQIGAMGGTSQAGNIDPHLHFEVRKSANIDLSKNNPFQGQVYWPKTLDELITNFIDLGATNFANYDSNFFQSP